MKLRRGKYSINGFFSNGSKSMGSNVSFSSSDFGSRDEIFYESKPCFDSDCDEEFYSVRGSEFTPSRTNTPNNQTATPTPHRLSKSISIGPIIPNGESEIQPCVETKARSDDKRPRLADFLRAEQESENETMMKNSNGFRIEKLDSINETSDGHQNRRKKRFRIVRCCVPGLEFKLGSKENREKEKEA
ncbi:hypothetical protein LUZ60_004802 [Juncus effusus]|nr:hypothetical protein LUZ60_004802 [Juncus effusus]